LSRQQGATLFMTLLAAFQTLLHRYTGQDDIFVGTPIAGRNRVDLENVIGFFINTLVMRADFTGEPIFQELLARVRAGALGAYAHQDLPFEKLVEELQPQRTVGASPLFQVTFGFQNLQEETFRLRGMTVTPFEVESVTAKFDLSLRIREQTDGLRAVLEYSTDLFDAGTMDRMLGHYHKLLEGVVKDPGQRISEIAILTDPEKDQLLIEWNDTQRDYPKDQCVHELFEAQVEQIPDAVAVAFSEQQLTYRELNRRANQLAHYLKKLGVAAETLVGICVEPSLEMIVGILGILKAGGAYVPLDPSYPKERLEFMIEDTRAAVLLTQQALLESLPEHVAKILCLDTDWGKIGRESKENLAEQVTADNLVYVIYTSGSTGEPKGVMICHKNLVNYLSWINGSEFSSRWQNLPLLMKFTFDGSLKQLFGPLIRGGPVWIVSNDIISQPAACLEALGTHSCAALNCVPSLWSSFLDTIEKNQTLASRAGLSVLLLGGEQSWNGLIDRTVSALPQLEIWNLYGPTEATANAIVGKITAAERITLGRPLANTEIYILDSQMHPVPIGIAGELYIGGAGIARGYLNRPELTAEKFIPNPFRSDPGTRLYRTGDLARYLPDGKIEFLGRVDNQVKIRGYRVEPGEIESVLRQHPGVKETVVTVREDDPSDKRLIAYVVPRNHFVLNSAALRSYLKAKLPGYMIPSAFVFLDALPLTPHGKLDQRALPAPEQSRPELAESYQAPRNPVEESLARIWAEVLKLEKVGVHDNFFDLGGHSLKAVQVISRARKAFEVDLPLRRLFETPTIVGLAEAIETLRWAKQNAAPRDDALTTEEETGEV
jgi:amino acid adenylation domain-containing protein